MGRQSAYKMCANVRRANFETSVHRYHIRHTVLIYAWCSIRHATLSTYHCARSGPKSMAKAKTIYGCP
ncbi:hypothetical protein HBH98_024160 [Parastagonospora nodorum]|nr:hypothetical protein HBH53_076690 [Parastagonospora nodorum]KAH4005457.1 hypothetical protein HBI10_030710 [Parastagonospora nodorum]KAH4033268.1 hypothetical protein HBI13_008430 [Parastagonospora nodorum]KAH4060762.1 hypothetical protein HBH49_006280 [Parastagonospora nodorum]KAH4073410.1 hypothetical protein HBH50_053680 [Parastagonospora nodorum]